MQSQDSKDKRPKEKLINRGRNNERSTLQGTSELVSSEVTDLANRTVCLSANLIGKGNMA